MCTFFLDGIAGQVEFTVIYTSSASQFQEHHRHTQTQKTHENINYKYILKRKAISAEVSIRKQDDTKVGGIIDSKDGYQNNTEGS